MQDNNIGFKPYRYFPHIRYNNFLILLNVMIMLIGFYFIRYSEKFYEILPQIMGTAMVFIGITKIMYSVSTREYKSLTTREP